MSSQKLLEFKTDQSTTHQFSINIEGSDQKPKSRLMIPISENGSILCLPGKLIQDNIIEVSIPPLEHLIDNDIKSINKILLRISSIIISKLTIKMQILNG